MTNTIEELRALADRLRRGEPVTGNDLALIERAADELEGS